ncbi:MAG TPA: DUF362 domain-containing protein [Armatimonadota bacterium]|nr:DUF362 domain-containing protein [Armatimonadota bacterium]
MSGEESRERQVALVRCAAYEPAIVAAALNEALELLGGLERFVRRGDRVLVKPNLLTAQPPESAATTHPQIVDALLARLSDLGAKARIGDSPAFGWVRQVAEGCGVAEVARRYGAPLVEFTRPVAVKSARPEVLPEFRIDREVVEADVVINLPKLKAHRQLGFTGAVKNLYGCMPGKRKAYYHVARGNRDSDFARLVAAFAYTVRPALNLADAVVAMEREGPTRGDPRPVAALVAGADAAGVDAALAGLIRPREADNLILNACRALGLGFPDTDKIDLLGGSLAEMAIPDFVHPYLIGVRFSPGRLARSTWRNFLITRFGYDPAR